MIKEKIKEITDQKDTGNNKKKIENTVFLIIILIITILIINFILKDDKKSSEEQNEETSYKTLAEINTDTSSDDLQSQLEKILGTIKGVGKVKVFLNYSESKKTIAMYDEKTTTSSTEETDSEGGLRNTTSTEVQKDVIYSKKDGGEVPMTEKIIMPTIEGAIITAVGARNASIRTNIVNAVKSATGLSIDKIQVFEMEV